MGAYFWLFKDSVGYFRFNLHAPNGEKILHSESYPRKDECLDGIESVKTNSTSRENFKTYKDRAGKPRFRLLALNGEIIGHSEAYENIRGCHKGIASVMQNAPAAEIKDLTNPSWRYSAEG